MEIEELCSIYTQSMMVMPWYVLMQRSHFELLEFGLRINLIGEPGEIFPSMKM